MNKLIQHLLICPCKRKGLHCNSDSGGSRALAPEKRDWRNRRWSSGPQVKDLLALWREGLNQREKLPSRQFLERTCMLLNAFRHCINCLEGVRSLQYCSPYCRSPLHFPQPVTLVQYINHLNILLAGCTGEHSLETGLAKPFSHAGSGRCPPHHRGCLARAQTGSEHCRAGAVPLTFICYSLQSCLKEEHFGARFLKR